MGGNPANVTVNLGRAAAVIGVSSAVTANGWFSITVESPAGQNGTATAQAVDDAGQESELAAFTIST